MNDLLPLMSRRVDCELRAFEGILAKRDPTFEKRWGEEEGP